MAQALLFKNIQRLYVFAFFRMALIIIPVIIPYFKSLGLTMQEVFEIQAVFALAVTIFEVPSGYLSDIWGRRRTLIIGSFLSGLGFTMLIFVDDYMGFVFYEFVLGVAVSLVSGTDISLLYDSVASEDKGQRVSHTHHMGHFQFSQMLGETIASLLGGILVLWSYDHVVWAQVLFGWGSFFVALSFVEPDFEKMSNQSHAQNFKRVIAVIWNQSQGMRLIFLNLVVWGLATFFMVWVFQDYWQNEGVALKYFGYLWAAYNFIVAIVSRFSHWAKAKFSVRTLLVVLGGLPILGYLGMGAFGGWVGVTFGVCFQISRGLNQVILKDAFNTRLESQYRATANSLVSFLFRMIFCLLGPAIGYFLDEIGTQWTLYGLAGVFAVLYVMLLLPLAREF